MSDDKIQVEFGAKTDGVVQGSEAAAKAVRRSVDEMNESFSLVGGEVEGLEHRFEHLAVSASFALSSLADGSERGVTRVGHALASLGFAFGGAAGGLTTAIAIAGERMIDTMHEVSSEAAKAQKAVEDSAEQMRRASDGLGLKHQAELAQGDVDEAEQKQRQVASAYDEAKTKLEQLHQEVGRGSPLYRRAKDDEIALYDALKKANEAVDAAKDKLKSYGAALLNVRSAKPDLSGALGVTTDASKPKTPEEIAKEFDQAFKSIQSGINSLGKELNSQATENAQRFVNEAVRAANEDHEAHQRANEEKERDREEFWNFVERLDEAHAKAEKERIDASQREWLTLFGDVTHAWQDTVQKINSGGDDIRNFWKDLWHDLVDEAIAGEVRMIEERAASELAKNDITAASVATRVGLELAASAKIIAMYALEAAAALADIAKVIAGYAAEAAAAIAAAAAGALTGGGGGGSSLLGAGLTVGGWLVGGPIGGIVGGVVGGLLGHLFDVTTGYNVPAGIAAMGQPLSLAPSGGGAMSAVGASHEVHVHFNVSAMDSRDVKRFFIDNHKELAAGVQKAVQNGVLRAQHPSHK